MIAVNFMRVIPLIVGLIIFALATYTIITFVHSHLKAKEVLIALFSRFNIAALAVALAITLYAALDGSTVFAELSLSCAAVFLIALLITLICRAIFLRNHPEYRKKPSTTRLIGRKGRR